MTIVDSRLPLKAYTSKLLLFGEYTIINGSRALAIPYAGYFGKWLSGTAPDPRLLAFADYLKKKQGVKAYLDLGAFEKDISEGLFFQSNIPVGYGLGSSGALCAAVYDRYALDPIGAGETDLFGLLKSRLAEMESFFHGSSSGTDPLISYLDHPVLIHPGEGIRKVSLPEVGRMPLIFFLLDTGISRSTGPLVEHYLEQCRQAVYAKRIADRLVPLVDHLIDDFLQASWHQVAAALPKISSFQMEHFSAMIPASLRSVWEAGLSSGAYYLKLCGAGGGGFLLGMTRDIEALEKLHQQFPCTRIW